MATIHDSSIKFFSKASSDQWLFVLSQYKEVFKQRAQATRGSKKSGPQEAIKLDNWYQEELPNILLSRKDKHVRHEELVQITKWKLWRTKNRAGLLDLVRMNTELAVKQVSTKAFKKCPSNLHGAISALVNLKGIGVATASAVLCACFPEICPFMADECLDSVPGIENTNYTVNEFIAFADQIKACCERLQAEDPSAKWTPHKVELTLWTHYWIKEMKLNLLEKMPTSEGLEEDETEERGSSIDANNISRNNNNGGSHVKLSSTSSSNGGGVSGRVVDEDSNISVPVSNASEVDDDDDSRSVDASIGGKNNNGTCSSSNSSRLMMMNNSNTNSNSAYNCIEDSKDGMVRSSSSIVDENSRQQMLSNGDNSNLSYSNLSSDDLNNSTTENTTDNGMDCPTNLSMPTGSNNNNITGSNVESSTSSSSTNTNTNTNTTTPSITNSTTTMSNIDSNTNMNINTAVAAVPKATAITTNNNNDNDNDNSITSDVTSSTLTPPLPQAPVVATPVVVVTHAEEGESSTVVPVVGTTSLEPESGTSNGHIASNGESYNGVDNEIKSDKVCSSSNNISINISNNNNTNNLKRPVEEITSSGDDLKDDGISEKKSRVD